MGKKGDGDMQAVTEEFIDKSQVLSLKQVKSYADTMTGRGHAEYNNGAILVKSRHPLDQCLRRGIIEQQHHDSGKRLMTIRDCAYSKSAGRSYNAAGGEDSVIDAATLYANLWKYMPKVVRGYTDPSAFLKLVCFSEPDINGDYFEEKDYAFLYSLAPKIQNAFELLDKAVQEAREEIKVRIERSAAKT